MVRTERNIRKTAVAGSSAGALYRLLILCIVLVCLPAGAAALQVEIDGDVPEEVVEGELIDFTITLSGIPPAADMLHLDTDLLRFGDVPLFVPAEGGNATNTTPLNLPVPPGSGPMSVRLQGQVPAVTEITQCGAVVLTTFDPKRSGYTYYRVRFTDDDGNTLTESDTRLFSIRVETIDTFRDKLNRIDDPFMRSYLQEIFEKGLVNEANTLANYELGREDGIPIIWAAAGIVVTAIAALIAGIWIGGREIGGGEE
ncbi:hypothetical protein [Methanofollis fontis]|uniref:Uncharacterized protein n=1 Tax=Methanofollis fontis TaxID=2052832 RepID=A0A483CY05_9EURY|nr:hypothetical protein [Methanofollis fontis]TAJ44929.1 hypothetical protein CUJ86_06520 [Methanofollis fontis]